MRWRFPAPEESSEGRERARVIARIDAFWRAFAATADTIDAFFRREAELDLAEWMHTHLGAISPELMWEYGPAVRGPGHRLAITPEANRHLRPLTDALLARAPAIPRWELYPYRLPDAPEMTPRVVEARTSASFEGYRVAVAPSDDYGVNLTYWSPRCEGPDDDTASAAAFVATESLLGEEVLDKSVDFIDVAREPVADAWDVALEQLPGTVAAVLRDQREKLPARPLFESAEEEQPWSLLELTPREAPDYTHQLDMFVGKTMHLPMWQRAHSDRVFASSRFSRFRETFCFVKVDGSEGLTPGGFEDKAAIEDALDAALVPAGLGRHVGGGTGWRYSYVDLALTDVDRAIPVIRGAMRKGKLPKRSWLLFFDSAWRDEWVPIWDDTPPPP